MNTAPDIGSLIGNTPLIKLELEEIPSHIQVYGKLEGHNPGGSVKDRPAYNMLKQAIKRDEINRKSKIIEATSGNTGIALAMVASFLKLDLTLVMPENSTQERVDTMKAFGANVILTPADGTIEYSRELAEKMASEDGYYILNQFENPDNYLAHYHSTGPEIWRDTDGEITHFVSSMGTTGTIMGNSRYLKEKNKSIQIIGVQPSEGSSIPGIRKWSPEFLPKIYEPERVDHIELVSEKEATETTRRLSREMGIFAGMSSGGVIAGMLKYIKTIKEKACIVCIVCDRGDRYLSSQLFRF